MFQWVADRTASAMADRDPINAQGGTVGHSIIAVRTVGTNHIDVIAMASQIDDVSADDGVSRKKDAA